MRFILFLDVGWGVDLSTLNWGKYQGLFSPTLTSIPWIFLQQFWYSDDCALWHILIMKANEMHCFSDLFDKVLYMFQTSPLSIIRSISTLYTYNRCSILTTLADAKRTRMTNTYCVYTGLRYSWWLTVDMSEIWRVLYQINLRNSASCWLSL
jgi:hypothetical protein